MGARACRAAHVGGVVMSSWAARGVKCVYVGVSPHKNTRIIPLERGGTYTIRAVFLHPSRGELGCLLEEVTNELSDYFGIEMGYILTNFRPLATRTQEQDLAIFLPLLETAGEDA